MRSILLGALLLISCSPAAHPAAPRGDRPLTSEESARVRAWQAQEEQAHADGPSPTGPVGAPRPGRLIVDCDELSRRLQTKRAEFDIAVKEREQWVREHCQGTVVYDTTVRFDGSEVQRHPRAGWTCDGKPVDVPWTAKEVSLDADIFNIQLSIDKHCR